MTSQHDTPPHDTSRHGSSPPGGIDLDGYPYASARMPVLARNGMVAASQPLAAQAGLQALRAGGNAVDAAIATAVTLTVVEPTMNGIGADAFALVWDGATLHGLNGSGRAPALHTAERFAAHGYATMPRFGWPSITVPGAPMAWRDLHERFGRLPFASLFDAGIEYARHGYPVSPLTAGLWQDAARSYRARLSGAVFEPWFETFTPGGVAPGAGDVWRSEGHARTLEAIAGSGAADFYSGEVAGAIADFAAATGGLLSRADLAAHHGTWDEPIRTAYRGYDVWEMPPNGQGLAALIALNILEEFDVAADQRDTVAGYHRQIEAMKLGFSDAIAYVADPERAEVPVAALLDRDYARARAALIGEQAITPAPGSPPGGGTVYLCAADADGMMVSMIQSNYMGFGSGLVVPGTGIAIQNRGSGFTLDPRHPNCVAPGKRPYHTIIPGFLSRDGEAIGPFGVMGGYMQPQGHVQMVVNQVDYGMNPQASLDAPRWQWMGGREVGLEDGVPAALVAGLRARGHATSVMPTDVGFGRGQIIRRLPNGAYVAGSDPRADGCAVGW